jgi:hypothetical protein
MRFASIIVPLSACAFLCGCFDDIDPLDDGFEPPPPDPACIEAADRGEHSVTVAGAVVDFETGEPVDRADVAVNTAWDIEAEFPATCPPLAVLATDGDGLFGPETVDAGSTISPPIAIFLVSGAGLADTASDETLDCPGRKCADVDHAIAAPAEDLAESWRAELEADGMPNADQRGLILFQYLELDGSPAEGVEPATLSGGAAKLIPDVEVRFLEADGVTLAPPGTAETTASGFALIGVSGEIVDEYVFGVRGEGESWPLIGALDPTGWIFVEQARMLEPE